MSLDPYFIPDTKVNLKCIMDINVKSKMIKPLKGHKGEYFHGLGVGKGFSGRRKQSSKNGQIV